MTKRNIKVYRVLDDNGDELCPSTKSVFTTFSGAKRRLNDQQKLWEHMTKFAHHKARIDSLSPVDRYKIYEYSLDNPTLVFSDDKKV